MDDPPRYRHVRVPHRNPRSRPSLCPTQPPSVEHTAKRKPAVKRRGGEHLYQSRDIGPRQGPSAYIGYISAYVRKEPRVRLNRKEITVTMTRTPPQRRKPLRQRQAVV